MSWDLFGVLIQLILALGIVLGVMWVAARLMRNAGGGRGAGIVEMIARQPVGRTSAVVVVRVAERALIVGVTDEKVTLLSEADLEIIEAAQAEEEERRAAARGGRTGATAIGSGRSGAGSGGAQSSGALSGSILSPSTWRQTVDAIRDRTARRG